TGKEQQVDVLFTYKLVTDTAEKA
ncbi:MAG: hypothetical protein QOD51_2981, partial [Candidatus Eremiobacteraeota bacterium]|nr:hypothetical protein [Candidatus Eremiobacteraeota bacterium]